MSTSGEIRSRTLVAQALRVPSIYIRYRESSASWGQEDFTTLFVVDTIADLWRSCIALSKGYMRPIVTLFFMKGDIYPRWEDSAFDNGIHVYSGMSHLAPSTIIQECLLSFCSKDGPDAPEIRGLSMQRKGKDHLIKIWCSHQCDVAASLLSDTLRTTTTRHKFHIIE